MKNKPDGLFFNQDLRRSVANPVIAGANWRFGRARLSVKRFGMEANMIKTTAILLDELRQYANPQKPNCPVWSDRGKYIHITKGTV